MFCEYGTQRKNVSFLVAVMLLALVLICVSVRILCTDVACKNPTHYEQLANLRRRLLTRVSQLLRPASLTRATTIVGRVGWVIREDCAPAPEILVLAWIMG